MEEILMHQNFKTIEHKKSPSFLKSFLVSTGGETRTLTPRGTRS